jgi:hypothetical protein
MAIVEDTKKSVNFETFAVPSLPTGINVKYATISKESRILLEIIS